MRFLLALLISLACMVTVGQGHEWYAPYKNPSGISCCGGRDCHELPDEDVRQVATGYAVKLGEQEILIPFDRAQPSEDKHFHICIWGEQVQCFFAPILGV